MIINGADLLSRRPIKNMLTEKVRFEGVSHGLSEAGYDIRLKQQIWLYAPHYHITGSLVRSAHHFVGADIHEGNFALGSSVEEFDMPDNLVGIVHDKSTLARQGLSVFNTVIEPGWKGFLTLELVYNGQTNLCIPAGSGIAQVLFHETSTKALYAGKYQSQDDRPVPAIFSEF